MSDTEPSDDDPPAEPPDRFDVLRYQALGYRAVPAGDARAVVEAHVSEARQRRALGSLTVALLPWVGGVLYPLLYSGPFWPITGLGFVLGCVAGVARYLYEDSPSGIPELVASDVSERVVCEYVEDFDPEEVTGPFE